MNHILKLKNNMETALSKQPFLYKVYGSVKYELPVLVCLLIFFVSLNRDVLDDPYTIVHYFDYRIGFAPRLFIGSVMSLFTDNKTLAFMNSFKDIVCIAALVLFAFAAGRVIRKAGKETKATAIIFVILFISVPYSLHALYPTLLSLDRFLVVYTFLALMAVNKKAIKWFVPALLFIGLATYQGFAFTYMPAVAIVLIYEVFRNKKSKQSIALCAVCFTAMAVISAYFFLYKGIGTFNNVKELVEYAAAKTDINNYTGEWNTEIVLNNLFFEKPVDFFWKITIPLEGWNGLKYEFSGMLSLLPLLIIFFLIWKNAIKNSSSKLEKFVYILCMSAPLMRLPMFILSTNFLRGRISVIIVQFFLVFYFLYVGNPAVTESAKKIGEFLKKNYILFFMMILYFLFFVKMH